MTSFFFLGGGMRGRRGPCYALYSLKQICFTCTVSGYQSVPMLNCNRMWSEIHFGSVFLSLQYFPLWTSNCSAQNLFNCKQQGLFGCQFAEPFHPYNLPYSTRYIWTPFSLPLVWFLLLLVFGGIQYEFLQQHICDSTICFFFNCCERYCLCRPTLPLLPTSPLMRHFHTRLPSPLLPTPPLLRPFHSRPPCPNPFTETFSGQTTLLLWPFFF